MKYQVRTRRGRSKSTGQIKTRSTFSFQSRTLACEEAMNTGTREEERIRLHCSSVAVLRRQKAWTIVRSSEVPPPILDTEVFGWRRPSSWTSFTQTESALPGGQLAQEHQQSLTIDFVFYLLLFVQTGSQMRFWSNLCESLTSLFWSFMPGIRHNSTWRISAADGDDRTVGRACPKSSLRSEGCWPACSCHQINKMQRSELSKNCEIVIGFSIIISRSKPVATTCGYLTLRDLRAKQKEQIFFSFRDENHRGLYF